ncbi:hypothetical protein [Bacillus wiedmannii]
MVLWFEYSDFTDNWVVLHPGHCFIGVFDLHPDSIVVT